MEKDRSNGAIIASIVVYVLWGVAGFMGGRLYPNHHTLSELSRDEQMFTYGITVAARASGKLDLACRWLADDAENFPNEVKALQDSPTVIKYIDPIRKECNAASKIGMPYDVTPDPRSRGDNVLPGNVAPPEKGNCLVYDENHEPGYESCPDAPAKKRYKAGPDGAPQQTQ